MWSAALTSKNTFVPYNYLDALNFESLLTKEEKIILENVNPNSW